MQEEKKEMWVVTTQIQNGEEWDYLVATAETHEEGRKEVERVFKGLTDHTFAHVGFQRTDEGDTITLAEENSSWNIIRIRLQKLSDLRLENLEQT